MLGYILLRPFDRLLLADVELLELLLGELLHAGGRHEAVGVLGRQQLEVLQVGRLHNLGLVPREAEGQAGLE